VLKRIFTKISEITQCNGHYAVQGHSRSPILVPNRKLIYDFLLVINTNIPPSSTASKLWLIIGQIFATESGVPRYNALAEGDLANITIS